MNTEQKIKILKAYVKVDTKIGFPRTIIGGVALFSRIPIINALGALSVITGVASPAIVARAEQEIQALRAEQATRPWENTAGIPEESAPARRRRIL